MHDPDDSTIRVSIGDFRAHMAMYLTSVKAGRVVVLTSHGKTVAELHGPGDHRAAARDRLAALARQATIGDVVGPSIDAFGSA